ncbi:hypothetical protein D3C84_961000 [compost metagenome]
MGFCDVEELAQRLGNGRPTFVGNPCNGGEAINTQRLAGLPVAEQQKHVRAMLFRSEVRGVGQIIGDVELHVRERGHHATSWSLY